MDITLTREQIRQVDRIAIEEYAINGLVLMENAGRNAAAVIVEKIARRKTCPSKPAIERVVVFCGSGNNGGDGFVIARHLANAGFAVEIAVVGDSHRLTADAAANHRICAAMKLPMLPPDRVRLTANDLVVDALLGTGFQGQVRQPLAGIIQLINGAPKAGVVAVDVPSGLDCNTGMPSNATIVADVTVTFVANKIGFIKEQAHPYVGRVHVADIGAPPQIVRDVAGG